ncbi:hypothetical protein D3C78_1489620 [compost metagenome]
MHFVNRNRRIKIIRLFTLLALNDFFRQTANQRGGGRAHLRFEGIRIGFDAQLAVGIDHLEFIELTVVRAGDKQLPDAGLTTQTHRVAATIPVVKLPHHRDALRVGCPHGKTRSGDAVHRISMRAQRFVGA